MADPQTKLRRTELELPLLLLAIAIVGSLVTNVGRASSLSGDVLQAVSTWIGFIMLMYLAAGAIKTRRQLDRTLMLLVGSSAIVAFTAILEARTGRNYFNDLERFIPILDFDFGNIVAPAERGGAVRAYGSSQHAIPLGAMLVMMLPQALYLYKRTAHRVWPVAGLVLVMGALRRRPHRGRDADRDRARVPLAQARRHAPLPPAPAGGARRHPGGDAGDARRLQGDLLPQGRTRRGGDRPARAPAPGACRTSVRAWTNGAASRSSARASAQGSPASSTACRTRASWTTSGSRACSRSA